jgi:hypothetical protein
MWMSKLLKLHMVNMCSSVHDKEKYSEWGMLSNFNWRIGFTLLSLTLYLFCPMLSLPYTTSRHQPTTLFLFLHSWHCSQKLGTRVLETYFHWKDTSQQLPTSGSHPSPPATVQAAEGSLGVGTRVCGSCGRKSGTHLPQHVWLKLRLHMGSDSDDLDTIRRRQKTKIWWHFSSSLLSYWPLRFYNLLGAGCIWLPVTIWDWLTNKDGLVNLFWRAREEGFLTQASKHSK